MNGHDCASGLKLYCDGGVIGRNPSPLGGTWAWCLVRVDRRLEVSREGAMVFSGWGHITPLGTGLPAVTNNYTELLAAVVALEAAPGGLQYRVFTDSQVTKYRLTGSKKFNGIPQDLKDRTLAVVASGKILGVTLLDGHPSKKQLASGVGKRGNPVSKWNVYCDQVCRKEAASFMASLEMKKAEEVSL